MASPTPDAQRVSLTEAVMEVLDDWHISTEDRLSLLGLAGRVKPRTIMRYRNGTPLPEGADIDQRCKHLLGIASALRTSFPHMASTGNLWITTPCRGFDQRTPLQIMLDQGLAGMERVRDYLDGRGAWG
jgi:hypothetical protein